MAIGYFLRVGDRTTCGGQILTGDNTFLFYGVSAAREGDMVTCGKHSGTYKILGGISNVWGNGRRMAGTLDSFSSCPCKSRMINTINDSYAKEEQPAPRMAAAPIQQPEQAFTQPSSSQPSAMPFVPAVDNRIRIDAQQLIDCADEICEKHLYYPETKSEFKHDVATFASTIVEEVESGQKSYEQGSAELEEEENSLIEQSKFWILNGLSILGGAGQIWAGGMLCATGGGCFIGAMLIAHGSNNIYEGVAGFYEGHTNAEGFLKEGYQTVAMGLGFDKSVGTLAYDMADFGLSLHGKLKLVPKLNEFGEAEKPLYLIKHARQDMERAYNQTRDLLLRFELGNDVIAIYKLREDIKNAFFLDKQSGEVTMVVTEPEKITNVKQILTDDCHRYIVFTSDDIDHSYFECPDPNNSNQTLKVNKDGDIIQ
ncbi:DUF4225 domain-containing protein [Providencia alcalifaciens]|uniref:DUF4225 domain-containing protein n=2 Tax=Providencia alcalifaciens TaxID=126385 RepID=A0AAW9V6C2_9GAMM|nr:killer protein of pyocin s3 [Providencia alcalifaciens Dmel2]MTC33338.1 DUF4225 domain-containing protein [Providencia alcalifaciens]